MIVDEAWLLMSEPSGAEFLFRMAKSARKHWAGLTVVTQDAGDLLGSPLGQAVVANAATQILLRQAPQSIDTLADAFGLSAGERAYLLGAAAAKASSPPGSTGWPSPPSPAPKKTTCAAPGSSRPSTTPPTSEPPTERRPRPT